MGIRCVITLSEVRRIWLDSRERESRKLNQIEKEVSGLEVITGVQLKCPGSVANLELPDKDNKVVGKMRQLWLELMISTPSYG